MANNVRLAGNKGGYMYNADGTKRNPNTTAHRLFNKGGEHMDEEEYYDDMGAQMEMSGLVQDEEVVDPVSGNDIPLGATAEGVRDDKTVALSAGEFVIPDYAVRYHGVDFYMSSLQRAKEGLAQMEDMGMTGKPEEAIMSADEPLPTMAGGGYAKNAALNVPVDTKMFEHGGLHSPTDLVQPLRPTVATVPVRAPTDPRASFAQLQGLTVKEYKNPETQKSVMVTMWNNQPYPPGTKVPKGFIPAAEADAIISAPSKLIAPATVGPTPVGPSEQDILEEEARDEAEYEASLDTKVKNRKKAIVVARLAAEEKGTSWDDAKVSTEHGMYIDGTFTDNASEIEKYQNVRNHTVLSDENPLSKTLKRIALIAASGGALAPVVALSSAYETITGGNNWFKKALNSIFQNPEDAIPGPEIDPTNPVSTQDAGGALITMVPSIANIAEDYGDILDEGGEGIRQISDALADSNSALVKQFNELDDEIHKPCISEPRLAPAPEPEPESEPESVASAADFDETQRALAEDYGGSLAYERGRNAVDAAILAQKAQKKSITPAPFVSQEAELQKTPEEREAERLIEEEAELAHQVAEEERQRGLDTIYGAPAEPPQPETKYVPEPEPEPEYDSRREEIVAQMREKEAEDEQDIYEYLNKGGLVKKPKKKKRRKKGKGLAKRK